MGDKDSSQSCFCDAHQGQSGPGLGWAGHSCAVGPVGEPLALGANGRKAMPFGTELQSLQILLYPFSVLGTKCRAWNMLVKFSTTEINLQHSLYFETEAY